MLLSVTLCVPLFVFVVVELSHNDVIILSSPIDGDDDVVFTSNYEIKIPEPSLANSAEPRLTFRSRTKSKQEELDDLEDLSQLAEQVLE